jgi:hypothetical protein
MTDETALPLSIRDTPPHPDAVRMTGVRPDGLPDGVHTGGAWEFQGEIWKPLDGRPYANCENHYPTREAEVLELMAGKPLFPRNWRIEERNGRRFLVRKRAFLIPDAVPYSELSLDQVLFVEQAVRDLNRAKWEIGDLISLAVDPDTYDLFFLDLSAAHPQDGQGCYRADEEWRIREFFKLCGADRLSKLRNHARHVLLNDLWMLEHPEHRHVYASFNRPISGLWASIPGDPEYIHNQYADWTESIPHTWVITKEPLDQETMQRYELTWGWSPIHND